MSKENMQRFLEKVFTDEGLSEKLKELEESHIRKLITLAGEVGIPLTGDDFTEAAQTGYQR